MDFGLVNAFLSSTPSNETEGLVQINIKNLNDARMKLLDKRNETASLLRKEEEELVKLTGALENQLSLAEFIAKQKGLEPVLPQDVSQDSSDQEKIAD